MSDRVSESPEVCLIVVNFASSGLLAFNDVLVGRDPALRIIVVDNFSSEREQAELTRLASAHGWDLLLNDENLGFGVAVNQGVRRSVAGGVYACVTLNPDAFADASAIRELGAMVGRAPGALIGPLILDARGNVWASGGRVSGWSARAYQPRSPLACIDWLTGACLAFDGRRFLEVGGFSRKYFMYWEDVDLSRRWAARGGQLVLAESLVVRHDVGRTQSDSAGRAKSPLYFHMNTRNRMIFACEHFRGMKLFWWALLAPVFALRWFVAGRAYESEQMAACAGALVRGTAEGLAWYVRCVLRARRKSSRRLSRSSGLS